jgi:hypothetical protein
MLPQRLKLRHGNLAEELRRIRARSTILTVGKIGLARQTFSPFLRLISQRNPSALRGVP